MLSKVLKQTLAAGTSLMQHIPITGASLWDVRVHVETWCRFRVGYGIASAAGFDTTIDNWFKD
jgi:hypothetical protein